METRWPGVGTAGLVPEWLSVHRLVQGSGYHGWVGVPVPSPGLAPVPNLPYPGPAPSLPYPGLYLAYTSLAWPCTYPGWVSPCPGVSLAGCLLARCLAGCLPGRVSG